MRKYAEIFFASFSDYGGYLWREILNPGWGNYIYWLIGISVFFWLLEIIFPWRQHQAKIRQDFWLDGFYMFFNFFLFSLIGYNAISNIGVEAFNDFLALFGIKNLVAFEIQSWPVWGQLYPSLCSGILSNGMCIAFCTGPIFCGDFINSTIRFSKWDLLPICVFIGEKQ